MDPIEQLASWIDESPRWVFFGGAGVFYRKRYPRFPQ